MRVVHIGFPKTGTTFLQRSVFTRLPGRFRYFGEQVAAAFFEPLIHEDDTLFDLAALKRRIEDAWGDCDALFSYEPLTGLHHQTGFVNRTLIANRLHALGFERVIITIRNQYGALESAYKEYIRNGGVLTFRDYVSFSPVKPRYLYPEYYDYRPIHALYRDLFGKGNVLVLQYERLGEPAFAADLGRFLGIDGVSFDHRTRVNSSLSRRKTALLRIINHVTYNSYRPSHLISRRISTSLAVSLLRRLPLLDGGGSCLVQRDRDAIAAFFRDANRQLERDAGIVLTADYP